MNKYLIFRTDRIGDFLILAILIKSIRRNDPDSFYKYFYVFVYEFNIIIINIY